MRIALDVTQILKKEGRGIARYIQAVVPELVDLHPSSQWNLCIRGSRWSRRGLVDDWLPSVKRSWLPFSSWMTAGGADLFHRKVKSKKVDKSFFPKDLLTIMEQNPKFYFGPNS